MSKNFPDGPPARKVADLISSGDVPIARLLSKARELARIEDLLGQCLEPGLMQQTRCAGIERDHLILLTPSSAIAASLRFNEDEILEQLRSAGLHDLDHLIVRTAPLPDHLTSQD